MTPQEEVKDLANQLVNHWLRSDAVINSPLWIIQRQELREKFYNSFNQLEKKNYSQEELDSNEEF
jgi:hypothetical protein